MPELSVKIDPTSAVSGARVVRRELDQIANSAESTERSLHDAASAAGSIRFDAQGRLRNGLGQYASAVDQARMATERMGGSANDNFRRMQQQMGATSGVSGRLAVSFNGLRGSVLSLSAAAGLAMRTLAPLMALVAAGSAGTSVIRTATEFETLGASLKTVTGSAANAERAFAFIQQFATETPYSLQQVTEAFIRLQGLGLDPSRAALESYGNTASALGKPIMQFVEAVADAVTGEFERLKEFGIRASQDGDRLSVTFQGVTKTIGNNAKEIEAYLRDLGRDQFAGAMADQMSTLGGIFSGLQDEVSKFQNAIGEGGLSAAVKRVTQSTTEFLAANQGLASVLGALSGGAINLLADGMGLLAAGVTEAWRWLKATGEVVAALIPTFEGAGQRVVGSAQGMITAAEAFASAWQASGQAIYAVLNAIIGAGVGAYQSIVATWDQLPAAFSSLAKSAANMLVSGLEAGVNGALAGVNSVIEAINGIAPEFAQIPTVPGIDLSDYRQSLTEAETVTAQTIGTIVQAATSVDYLGAGMDALAAPIAAAGAEISAAKDRIDAAATSANKLGTEAKLTGEGFQIAATGADAAGTATEGAGKKAEKAAEAFQKQRYSVAETAAELQRQIDTFDASEGATARLEFVTREMAKAWQIAREAGLKAIPAETISAINAAAGQVEVLTDKLNAMRLVRSATDEFFPFEKANREAAELQSVLDNTSLSLSGVERTAVGLAIDEKFVDAQKAADDLATKGTKAARDIGKSFAENVGDTFADIFSSAIRDGENFFDSLLRGFAGLGSQLAAAGAKSILGKLFNLPTDGSEKSAAGIGGLLSSAGSIAGAGSSSAYSGSASAPLRALNDNLTKVGRSALDVAKQFNGLNERADSRVLDSFLRTSGNWKNLSAADTAWCAAFANAAIAQTGGQGTGSNLASSFMGWGTGTNAPKVGDIVVLKPQSRGASGHVGFVAGFGDGTVQVFGGNQSNGANTKSFGLDQVRGYRTAGPSSATQVYTDQRIVARGVSDGMKDFTRQWGGTPSPQAQAAMANGSFDGFSHNGAGGAGQGLFSQNALGVLGAGFGAFGSGYQSGSPFSGGLSGALGGYQAGPAISGLLGVGGMAGSLIGGIGGAALGILGGILGARKQREQVHRQKAEAWEQLRPQYEAFDQSLSGDGNGQLRQWITTQKGQLDQFMKVGGDAWKYGSGNSTAQFASTGTKMYGRFMEMMEEYREGLPDLMEDLTSGEGYEGAFAKGRAAAKDLKQRIKDMIDDVSIAFASDDIGVQTSAAWDAQAKEWEEQRNAAIEQAKKAAGEYSLSLLYTAQTSSEVEKSLDGFRGTAAGLQKVLTDLGWTAEQAAADIDDRLSQAIAKMGETFTDGFQRSINDLSGVGYNNDIADLIKQRDEALSDAALLGVDPSIVTKWFDLAAQDIVDGAELTGDAFADLVKAFPELSGVVKAFSETVADTAKEAARSRFDIVLQERAEAESALRAEYERTVDRIASITDFLSDMALDDNLSTLSGKEQFDAAQKAYRETLFKANGGDRDAQDKLLGVGQDYLDEARSYYATSEAYGAVYKEIEATLKASSKKMETELDVARRQASFLGDIAANTKGLSGLLSDFLKAQKTVDKALGDVNASRDWGKDPSKNKGYVSSLASVGLYYTGDFGKGGFQAYLDSLSTADRAKAKGAIGYQMGGLIPGYVNGGMVGNGTWNVDSVLARYAGGGHIGLAGGEFVMPAPRVTPQTMPMLEAMRSGRMVGNDNRDLVAAVGRLEALMRTQVTTTGNGLARVEQATDRGARATERAALTASREQSLRRTG